MPDEKRYEAQAKENARQARHRAAGGRAQQQRRDTAVDWDAAIRRFKAMMKALYRHG